MMEFDEIWAMFTPPQIVPVPGGVERPLWSVMIPTFNRTTYLRRTLESVLAQDPGREQMQIEVVDDCSTVEDPELVVRAIAEGRVGVSRNSQNLGLMRNLNRCIERARGHLIHILHSDDYVEPNFYSVIGDLATRYSECGFFATRIFYVDEEGVIFGVSRRIKSMENPTFDVAPMLRTQYFECPGVVVRRELYERCGGFNPELVYTGDWEMWVRAVHRGGGVVHPQPLASWRRHADHESSKLARSGEQIRDYLRLSEQLSRYPGYSDAPLRDMAIWQALGGYHSFAAKGDTTAAYRHLKLYRELVPLPVRAARCAINHLQRFAGNIRKLLETTQPLPPRP